MDGIAAVRTYVDRVVTGDNRCHGMKVLLLDAVTTQIVSSVYSQTEILAKEVYLVSRIDDANSNPKLKGESDVVRVTNGNSSSSMDSTTTNPTSSQLQSQEQSQRSHLKAVCFLRPTEINAGLLVRELTGRPRFSEYHLFFTGFVDKKHLVLLAENDETSAVRQVQEFFADVLPVDTDLATLNCRHTLAMAASVGTAWARDHAAVYGRNLEGLRSLLLALRRRPAAVRYDRSSAAAGRLAADLVEALARDDESDRLFRFATRRGASPSADSSGPLLLLLCDRSSDPTTPLLSQWTYQAMVHELLGLNNGRVDLKGAPGVSKDLQQVVLNPAQDEFFRTNRHKNFGELGENVRTLLDEYQKQTSQNTKDRLNSIEEMQQFMEKFPEIKAQSHTVSKHVAIVGELARLVDVCSLLDVSQFEQELACTEDHSTHIRELAEKLRSESVKIPDKLRLGLLYALRYEKTGNVQAVKNMMLKGGVSRDHVDLVDTILRYHKKETSSRLLFSNAPHNVFSKMTNRILTSVQGVANVYAQHVPLLMEVIHNAVKGKLKETAFPYASSQAYASSSLTSARNHPADDNNNNNNNNNNFRPTEIIVFMVGGITYEEATKITEFNENNPTHVKILLAGSTIHNSTSFLEELKEL